MSAFTSEFLNNEEFVVQYHIITNEESGEITLLKGTQYEATHMASVMTSTHRVSHITRPATKAEQLMHMHTINKEGI